MTAYSDFIVITAYTAYLLREGLAAVFNHERWVGNR